MSLRWSAMAAVLFVAALVDLVAAGWVWRRRGSVARRSLVALLLADAIWSFTYGAELVTVGRTTREVWGDLEYVGTSLLPVAWLTFVLSYTGRRDQIGRWLLAALTIEPLALFVLLSVPSWHDLVRHFAPGPLADVAVVRLGPAYWPHFAYTTGLAVAGTVLLTTRLLRMSRMYRRQALTLAVSVLLPVLGNIASSLNLPLAKLYDPTPVAASVGGLVLVWGAFRYRLLELLPVARNLAFDRLDDPILVVDGYGRIVDRNPAAGRLLGPGAGIGTRIQDLLQHRVAVLDATPSGVEISVEHDRRTREYELVASLIHDRGGHRTGQLIHLRDITSRKHAERRLRYLAEYDQLTALPNRQLLSDRLAQAVARARRTKGRCALLLIDLDRFKLINDSLGHVVGDQVLAQVADRLREGRRDEDTAARLGGDEFAIVLPEISDRDDAALVADRALAALAEPMTVDFRELIVTASAGVAVWPDDASDPQELFSCADTALYRAKDHGRNRTETGTVTSGNSAAHRLELGIDLWHAVRRGELRLDFQPLVDLRTGGLLGMEALLRWQHPRLGLLAPGDFLPVAAERGLTTDIDHWVLAQACGQAVRWTRGGGRVPVTVNVSAHRFADTSPTLSADVALILERTTLPPELLVLEINERTVIEDPEPVAAELDRVRALGVGVALDDFGAGHTSLTHLRRLPIGMLKIDQELVRGVSDDPDDAGIAAAVVTLAQILGMTVVAEGIERPDQLLALQQVGCTVGQGYLFSAPVDAEAADALVTARTVAVTVAP